jgi:hypothetical protein
MYEIPKSKEQILAKGIIFKVYIPMVFICFIRIAARIQQKLL